jgi:hypothetical protein
MKLSLYLGAAIASLALASSADAATITSYDIQNATVSGFGGWAHSYSGTITPTSGNYANYSGGGGTLNDGIVPTSEQSSELFDLSSFSPVITVNLDASYLLTRIDILDAIDDNDLPGSITSVDVTVGGQTATYSLTNYGFVGVSGVPQDQFITLTGLQASTAATSFTLSNFVSGSLDGPYASIGELTVNGNLAGVPEPTSWALMLVGFGGLGAALRRSRRTLVAVAA